MTLPWREITVGTFNASVRHVAVVCDTEFGVLTNYGCITAYVIPVVSSPSSGGHITDNMKLLEWSDAFHTTKSIVGNDISWARTKNATVVCNTVDEAKLRCERYAKLMVLK